MNFDKIKQQMDDQNMDEHLIPLHVEELKNTQLPLQKIRRNLRNEIIIQLIIILVFFILPGFIGLNPVAKGMYYILIFISSLITCNYLIRMSRYLKRSTNLSLNTKEVVVNTLHELRLTLEVYKTAIISGSLLLPIILFISFFGRGSAEKSHFFNVLTLNISFEKIILYVAGYLLIAILIDLLTSWWSNTLYGKYINALENILKRLNSGSADS